MRHPGPSPDPLPQAGEGADSLTSTCKGKWLAGHRGRGVLISFSHAARAFERTLRKSLNSSSLSRRSHDLVALARHRDAHGCGGRLANQIRAARGERSL